MANHGHCRSCYWWQMIEYYNNPNTLNVGLCWMQSDSKHKVFHKTKEDSYCPDYSKAKKANGLHPTNITSNLTAVQASGLAPIADAQSVSRCTSTRTTAR